jgi:hypothetical protein
MAAIVLIHRQMRVFQPQSGLHQYLAKTKNRLINLAVSTYRFSTILLALKEIIEEQGLFDPENRTIIVLNSELEKIFGTKALHVSQFRSELDKLLYRKPGRDHTFNIEIANKELEALNFWISVETETSGEDPSVFAEWKNELTATVKPDLLRILKKGGVLPKNAKQAMNIGKLKKALDNYIANKVNTVSGNRHVLTLNDSALSCLVKRNYLTKGQLENKIKEYIDFHYAN